MSDERTQRLVILVNESCRPPHGHASPSDVFSLTLVAGVVSFLEDSGMVEAADLVERLLVNELIPQVVNRFNSEVSR